MRTSQDRENAWKRNGLGLEWVQDNVSCSLSCCTSHLGSFIEFILTTSHRLQENRRETATTTAPTSRHKSVTRQKEASDELQFCLQCGTDCPPSKLHTNRHKLGGVVPPPFPKCPSPQHLNVPCFSQHRQL